MIVIEGILVKMFISLLVKCHIFIGVYVCLYIYSWSSLFMVVLFYKAATNTVSKPWPMSPKGNAGLGSYKPRATTFLSAAQYIALFYVHFCLETPYLIYIVYSLHWTHSQQYYDSCLNEDYLTHIFLCKAHQSIFVLRNTRCRIGDMLGGHF